VCKLEEVDAVDKTSEWTSEAEGFDVEVEPKTNPISKGKETQWNSNIDGKDYHFRYTKKLGEHIVTINGMEHMISEGFQSQLAGLDEPISFDGKEARLVKHRKMIDVAYGDVLLQSGEKYIRFPMWGWIPMALCLLMPLPMGYPDSIASFIAFTVLTGLLLVGSKLLKKKVPVWVITIIFFAAYMRTVPLSAGIATGGAYLCARIIRSNLSYFSKVLLSILVTVATWLLPLILVVVLLRFV